MVWLGYVFLQLRIQRNQFKWKNKLDLCKSVGESIMESVFMGKKVPCFNPFPAWLHSIPNLFSNVAVCIEYDDILLL